MKIGIPRERKDSEARVSLTPAGVFELTQRGHEVFVERNAGVGSGIPDGDFSESGAKIVGEAPEVWGNANLVLKVKEPVQSEYGFLRPDLVLFTYLHLAASRECTEALRKSGATSVAYETVETTGGHLPLLAPMSEIAGRIAAQVGAYHLMRPLGGSGVLMGGVAGSPRAHVVVIGAGAAGQQAAAMAVGMNAQVTVLDLDVERLRRLDDLYHGCLDTAYSTSLDLERLVLDADLVIGAVLLRGARAPRLVSNQLVARMRPGAVLIDIAIDQGGCFADSHPTTHAAPTYRVHDTLFYCVANMPAAVPRTSTHALTNVTLPYVLELADHGWREALGENAALRGGLSTHNGHLTSSAVARTHQMPYTEPAEALRE